MPSFHFGWNRSRGMLNSQGLNEVTTKNVVVIYFQIRRAMLEDLLRLYFKCDCFVWRNNDSMLGQDGWFAKSDLINYADITRRTIAHIL